MDAADVLYGVSMGGDGVTKVVSRRLPRDNAEETESDDGADPDEDEGDGGVLSAAA
jgi:chromosome segregation protein